LQFQVNQMNRFVNKVVVLTGGSSGIGRATALAFAREGARVVIAARRPQPGFDTVKEIERAGGTAVFVQTEVSKSEHVERLIARAVETFGRLDCAFNNAARTDEAIGPMADLSEQDFDKTIGVNLKGVWLGMKYQIRQMLRQERKGGVIVNTSSGNGLGGCPQASFYSATKAGIIALSKSAAWEYAKDGIRVNAFVAGAFRTPMLEGSMDRASGGEPEARKAVEERWMKMTAAGRSESRQRPRKRYFWLCSDASSYVVGHSLIVDGGLTSLWR
jgi:NAD(P)-dependent dehydrogenase (short-subunit alcohol dehydrogenase family)